MAKRRPNQIAQPDKPAGPVPVLDRYVFYYYDKREGVTVAFHGNGFNVRPADGDTVERRADGTYVFRTAIYKTILDRGIKDGKEYEKPVNVRTNNYKTAVVPPNYLWVEHESYYTES